MQKILSLLVFILLAIPTQSADAFWVWTPETNRFINPKYAVKDTPAEQLQLGKSFFDSKQYPQAIKEFKKLIKYYPRAKEAPEAQYYIASSYEALNNPFEAFQEYQVVIDKYPFSERGGEIIERQFQIGEMLLEGKNKSKWAKILESQYNVVEVFRQVIKNAPYGKLAAVSQYKIGLYLKEKGLFQEARDEFEKTINDYPDTEWAKAAQYQIALADAKRSTKAQYDQKVTQIAREEFEGFIQNHPETELSDDAKSHVQSLRDKEAENNFLVAEFYEKQKNFKAAKIYYNAVVTDFKDSLWAKKALERIQNLGTN